MQLLTERLFLIPLRPDGMRALLARTTDPELVQPYTDMLDLSLTHPDQWVWYTAWGLYQNDSGDWVGDLCFKGLPENGHPGVRASGLFHRGRPRRLPLGLRPARRHRRRGRDRPRQHRLAGCPPPGGIRAHRDDGRGRAEVYSAQRQTFPLSLPYRVLSG